MDKVEFNDRMEKLKNRIAEEDYVTALQIVEGIDWARVKNVNLLNTAATVYERNGKYREARNVLTLALERSPVGKHILYKLTELSVMAGDLEEAKENYYEFHQVAPTDVSNYVLQYMLLKATHAPFDQQLDPLQRYCDIEPDEKWMYELASAYESAGRPDECIAVCDKIALLFGASPIALKALRLKQRYAQLTEAQRSILYPRSTPKPSYTENTDNAEYTYGRAGTPEGYYYENNEKDPEAEKQKSNELAACRYENEDAAFYAYVKAMEKKIMDEEERLSEPKPRQIFYSNEQEQETGNQQIYARNEQVYRTAEEYAEQVENEEYTEYPEIEETISETADETMPQEEIPEEIEKEDRNQISFSFDDNNNLELADIPSILSDIDETKPAPIAENVIIPEIAVQAVSQPVKAPAFETVKIQEVMPEEIPSAGIKVPEPAERPEIAVQAEPAAEVFTAPQETENLPKPQETERTEIPERPQMTEKPSVTVYDEQPQTEVKEPEAKTLQKPRRKFHMIVEAKSINDGIEMAVERLKKIHTKYGFSNAATKTEAEKLNLKGLTDSIVSKIEGKDFVIVNAGDLEKSVSDAILRLVKTDESSLIIALIDTPDGLDRLEDNTPELFDVCDYVTEFEDGDENKAAKQETETEVKNKPEAENVTEKIPVAETDPVTSKTEKDEGQAKKIKEDRTPVKRSIGEINPEYRNNVKVTVPDDENAEMDMDSFVAYCKQYAESIDCSIDGKSMLALYERAELMEENGTLLTKVNAENLIEEAADRAEKPPIGKKLSSLFQAKYDKNGLLILKENDFIY